MIKFIKKQMNKDGFTLVELIIVIAVMAILAAIVVPRMSGITDSFKERADERMADTFARELEVRIQNGDTVANTGAVSDGTDKSKSVTNGDFYWFRDGNVVHVYVATAPGTPLATWFISGNAAEHGEVYVTRDTGGAIQ